MKKIEKLGYWEMDCERLYDFIFIVPTTQKTDDDYKTSYYIGLTVGEAPKIIDIYDCGTIFYNKDFRILNFDFETPWAKGIKIWQNNGRLKYSYGGTIEVVNKAEEAIK